jgi:hypothetical protein
MIEAILVVVDVPSHRRVEDAYYDSDLQSSEEVT